jgi:hypothetical protein
MLRIYKYTSPYEFQDFETHLFTTLRPKFDHANDKLIVSGQEYRISTINYIGLFNRLLDNLPSYTFSLTDKDETWGVFFHNSNFTLHVNPKLQGCKIYLKLTKTIAGDISITLPDNSFGVGIVNNVLTLSGSENERYFLKAIYENGEYDWSAASRTNGYSSGDGNYTAKGYSVTLAKNVDVKGTKQALDTLFNIQAQSPLVALNTIPVSGLREFGDNVASVQLTASTTKRTNPITSVIFRRNGAIIYNVPVPLANGGNESYTENTAVNSNTTFDVIVSDGSLSSSSSRVFSFVYPFYYGVGAKGLTSVQIQALTKSIVTKQNIAAITSPTNQVYYFAYPKSYGVLTSILDKNGFETIGGYTRTEVNFTMLDGTIQVYYVYEFNNNTTQVNFTNTYKF